MKIVKKAIKIIFVIFILFIITLLFLLSVYNPMFKNESFKELQRQISVSDNTDLQKITQIYKSTHNLKSIHRIFFSFNNNSFPRQEYPSLVTVRYVNPYLLNDNIPYIIIPFREIIYACKLEQDFSNDQLITFQLETSDFLYGNIGVRQAAKYYFNKEINTLTQKECIILILMTENPVLYNPIRNRPRLQNKIIFYQNYLNK